MALFRRCAAALILSVFLGLEAHAWELTVKDVRAPLFVYGKEKNNICVEVSNSDRWSVRTASVILTMKPKGAPEKKIKRSFGVRSQREDSILVPFDMADFPERAGMIEVTVKEGEKKIFSKAIVVRDSLAGLDGVTTKLGGLFGPNGDLCIVCTVLEDPAKYRKWAPIKWIKTRVDTSPKRVLLLGSPMVNTLDETEGPYIAKLRQLIEAEEESFTFVARGKGLRPIFEDMLKVKMLVDKYKPQVFILCLGLEDAYISVPVRAFARALDVLIDQVRAREIPPRIVLVTPVPMLSDLEFSEELDEAVRKIARKHHTDVVDLRNVLGKEERELRKSYGDVNSNVSNLYPVREAQERIAAAIARYVY